jgi:CelD/BcsL family acetyltransferase involved in cellulose biosynthesis
LILLDRLPSGTEWASRLGGHVAGREAAPVLPVRDRSWEDFLAGKSRNFRDQVRRRPRRLARAKAVAFRRVDSRGELDEGLESLFSLHARRWRRPGAFVGPLAAFHRRWAELALVRGWLRLWLLEAEGAPAAAWYGFRFAGADSYYQSGRDPRWDAFGVGGILFARTVEDAFADGQAEYRMLRGDEEYKGRWAEEERRLETVFAGRGPLGRAVTVAGAELAARPRARHALGRLAA